MAISKQVFTHRGVQFTRATERDDDGSPPWSRADGHGVVTEWIRPDQAPEGARELCREHGTARYYDWRASLEIARRDKWGLSDQDRRRLEVKYGRELTAEEVTRAAVEQDYQFLRGWCQDDWEYVGVAVTVDGTGLRASLWGIESIAESYIEEVARELADQILDEDLEPKIEELQRLAEARNAADNAARDAAGA